MRTIWIGGIQMEAIVKSKSYSKEIDGGGQEIVVCLITFHEEDPPCSVYLGFNCDCGNYDEYGETDDLDEGLPVVVVRPSDDDGWFLSAA